MSVTKTKSLLADSFRSGSRAMWAWSMSSPRLASPLSTRCSGSRCVPRPSSNCRVNSTQRAPTAQGWTGITIHRLVGGRVVEERGEEAAVGLIRQLGRDA